MSVMKNAPVLICKRCHKAYTFFLKTQGEDVDGTRLFKFMDGVLKDGICGDCQKQASWYAQQGRLDDWKAGRP